MKKLLTILLALMMLSVLASCNVAEPAQIPVADPAFEESPSEQTAPVEESAPVEEAAPTEEIASVEETAPAAEAAPVEEPAPAVELAPAVEPAFTEEAVPVEEIAAAEIPAPVEEIAAEAPAAQAVAAPEEGCNAETLPSEPEEEPAPPVLMAMVPAAPTSTAPEKTTSSALAVPVLVDVKPQGSTPAENEALLLAMGYNQGLNVGEDGTILPPDETVSTLD